MEKYIDKDKAIDDLLLLVAKKNKQIKKLEEGNKMFTGCSDCDKHGLCNIHKLEYLKYESERALSAYEDEILKQEREQNELPSS
jgi:hypothetical protein